MKHAFKTITPGAEVLRYIHPLKQCDAQAVIEIARTDPRIKTIIAFGSAITPHCGQGSDLDIAVRMRAGCSEDDFFAIGTALSRVTNSPCDIIDLDDIQNSFLWQQIKETGVTIYENFS